jgi:HEAT repeat protein
MNKFSEPNLRSRIVRKGKNRCVPLSSMEILDAIEVISEFPRRLEELFDMLEDRDRITRDRAALILARFVSLHPSRLLRFVPRIREALLNESAYVRWYLVHTAGVLCELYPRRLKVILPDLLERLQDQNKIVRMFAAKALARSAFHNPGNVERLFHDIDVEIPGIVNKVLRVAASKGWKPETAIDSSRR